MGVCSVAVSDSSNNCWLSSVSLDAGPGVVVSCVLISADAWIGLDSFFGRGLMRFFLELVVLLFKGVFDGLEGGLVALVSKGPRPEYKYLTARQSEGLLTWIVVTVVATQSSNK
jgi:hypothetical protein